MSLRSMRLTFLAAALLAPCSAAAWGQAQVGIGVNSDAGLAGNIVLDKSRSTSPQPSILMKLTVVECDPRKEATSGFDNWPALFSALIRRGSAYTPSPTHGGICALDSAIAAECLTLLQRAGVGRIVSEPKLVTEDGRQATLHTGGEIAVPTFDPDSGTRRVGFRNVGLELTTTPHFADDRFRIELQLTHSSLVKPEAGAAAGIDQRKVQATLDLAPGQTALIGQVPLDKPSLDAKALIVFLTAERTPYPLEGLKGTLELVENSSIVVEAPKWLINYRVDDPKVIAVRHVENQSRQVRIEAKEAGESTLVLTDDQGNDYTLKVVAKRDQGAPLRLIARLYPDAEVDIIPVRDTAIVRGTVARAEDADQIAEIVSQFYPGALNHLRVATPAAPLPVLPPQPAPQATSPVPTLQVAPPVSQPQPAPPQLAAPPLTVAPQSLPPQLATPVLPAHPALATPAAPLTVAPQQAPATPAAPVPVLPPVNPLSPTPTLPPLPMSPYRPPQAYPSFTAPTLPVPPTPAAFDSIRGLHEEVKLLRRDVNRLIDLLEKRLDEKTCAGEQGAADTPAVPDQPGASDEPPPAAGQAVHRMPNFVVYGPAETVAPLAADAEFLRDHLAKEWLGQALPHWAEPCPVNVSNTQKKAGGATSYMFQGREIFGMRMDVGGRPEDLTCVLRHEVMHAVLATHFGQPLPRWADEGIALAAEGNKHRDPRQQANLLAADDLIPLRDLFAMREYPEGAQGVHLLHAQGASLVTFFAERGGKQKLVQFLEDGLADGDWEAALQKHYDCATFAELETEWRKQTGLRVSS